MLSDQSLEIAHRIVTQLKQRGIKLTPREGTPVALLVGGMPAMPANLMPGQYVDVIARDAMGHGAVHGAESLHDEKMEWCVDLIFKGVSRDLDIAKNVVQPTIDMLADAVEKDLTEACSDRAHGFEIITENLPKLFLDQRMENLFERYQNLPVKPLQTLAVFPPLPLADIRRRINTGDDELNELIAEVVDSEAVDDLEQFYKWNFCQGGNDRLDFNMVEKWSNPSLLIILYFLTIGLEADLPDGVNGSLSTVNNYLKTLRGMCGAAVYRQMRAIERKIQNKELIRSIDGFGDERKIYVNKAVYDTFLDEGGSPEALFGAVCGKASLSYKTILDTAPKLEKQWYAYVEGVKSRNDANKLGLIVTSIRKCLAKHIDEMEDLPHGSGTKGEMQKRLVDVTRNFYLPDMDRLAHSLKRVVFQVIFPDHDNAKYILDSIDAQEVDGEDIGKVTSSVIQSLVAQWMVKNLEVTVGNVKV